METRRRVLLYGRSLILGTVGASLKRYPHLELVALAPPLPSPQELGALAPDVIIFDVEAARPEAAIALLEACPSLLLIGIGPSSDQMLLWSGQQSRALAMQDLVQAIDTLSASTRQPVRRSASLDRLRQLVSALMTFSRIPTRRQRLAFAVAAVGLGVVLLLAQSLASPHANAPLSGTAVGGGITPEAGLAFAAGMVLGGVLIGLWPRYARRWRWSGLSPSTWCCWTSSCRRWTATRYWRP